MSQYQGLYGTTEPIVSHAVAIIEKEFPVIEGIEHLAEKISVSKCHLIRCFTAQMGVSPGKYLTNVRINAAKDYLATQDHSVEAIAGLVGYACGNYFSKVFRKSTGMSPSTYRRTQRSNHKASQEAMQNHSRISDARGYL